MMTIKFIKAPAELSKRARTSTVNLNDREVKHLKLLLLESQYGKLEDPIFKQIFDAIREVE